MTWLRVPPEIRALAALAVGLLVFVGLFLLAGADDPARPYQIAVVSAFAAFLSTAAAWQRFPGWDVFVAGCAFAVAGAFHQTVLPGAWVGQSLLLLPGALVWYTAARATEAWLVFPLGYGSQPQGLKLDRLREELGPGSTLAALTGLSVAVGLLFLFPAAQLLALPLAAGASLALGLQFPVRRSLWPALGVLASLPVSCLAARGWAALSGIPPGPAADPWLLGGLLQAGATLGLWLSRWRRGEPRGPSREPRNGRSLPSP